MTIAQFTILELATAAGGVAGAIALILKQTQQSKCRTCNFCCGFCKCEREVPTDIENQINNTEDENKEAEPALSPFQPNTN